MNHGITTYDALIDNFRAQGADLVQVTHPFEGCAVVRMNDPARLKPKVHGGRRPE